MCSISITVSIKTDEYWRYSEHITQSEVRSRCQVPTQFKSHFTPTQLTNGIVGCFQLLISLLLMSVGCLDFEPFHNTLLFPKSILVPGSNNPILIQYTWCRFKSHPKAFLRYLYTYIFIFSMYVKNTLIWHEAKIVLIFYFVDKTHIVLWIHWTFL